MPPHVGTHDEKIHSNQIGNPEMGNKLEGKPPETTE